MENKPGDNSTGTSQAQAAVIRLSAPYLADLQAIIFRDCASYREAADAIEGVRLAIEELNKYTEAGAEAEAAYTAFCKTWETFRRAVPRIDQYRESMAALGKSLRKLERAAESTLKRKEKGFETSEPTIQATRY